MDEFPPLRSGTKQQNRPSRREQCAVEHLVEAGASVVVGDLVGVHVGRDGRGLPIGTPARLAHLVQRDGEQPGGELPFVGAGETGPALPGIDKGARR